MFAYRPPRSCSFPGVSGPDIFGRGFIRARALRRFSPLAAFVLIVFSPAAPAPAQETEQRKIIRNISIKGLQRESEQSLLAALQSTLRVGSEYDENKVSQAAGQLYLMGKFKGPPVPVIVKRETTVDIIFTVEERPQVVKVHFSGRKALTQHHLTTAEPTLKTRAGDPSVGVYVGR